MNLTEIRNETFTDADYEVLHPWEAKILQRIADGETARAVGEDFNLSPRRARRIAIKAWEKLRPSRTAAPLEAFRRGEPRLIPFRKEGYTGDMREAKIPHVFGSRARARVVLTRIARDQFPELFNIRVHGIGLSVGPWSIRTLGDWVFGCADWLGHVDITCRDDHTLLRWPTEAPPEVHNLIRKLVAHSN